MLNRLAEEERKAPASATPLFSIIVPCFNEEQSIASTLEALAGSLQADEPYEVIVVDDGSTDGTAAILDTLRPRYANVQVVNHESNRGYGAALKTGIRRARAELIAITDADGTYPNERLPELVRLCRHADMVVGARIGPGVVYSKLRAFPKIFLRAWVSWLARRNVPDINSGMRVFRRDAVLGFFKILPDTFSFTTTITLSMLTTSRIVEFVPISYAPREGRSKIKPIRDTWRFIKLILRTGVYFAPVRAFMPLIALLALATLASLAHDVFWLKDLREKTLLLSLFTINTGMFILLADMIDKRSGD